MRIEAVTASAGPAYVETLRDEAIAACAVIRILEEKAAAGAYRAAIIACSSDPGLGAAREALSIPVLGIGESSLLLARGLGVPYGILTNVLADEPAMRAIAQSYRLDTPLVSVRSSGYTVEEFDCGEPRAIDGLRSAAQAAIADGARALCLGCAAMAGLEDDLAQRFGVPVFEGVASAVQLALAYARLGETQMAAMQPGERA
jgi:allantoin racemase